MSNKAKPKAPNMPDVLAELEFRFLANLPEEELNDAVRVFMQIEQAHWFYEDFFVDNHKHLKTMKMKAFAQALFDQSVVLSPIADKCEQFFTKFKNYRHQIPVCGAIMLNEKCDKMLLVRSWQGKSWTFPRGKINEGEEEAPCAAREVYEETGYLPSIDPEQHARLEAMDHGKKVILYVVPGVVENQDFAPKARKEVSKVDWFPLNSIPKGHYNVAPFMGRLKKIAASLRKGGKKSHTLKVPQSASKKQCNNLSPNSRSMRECTHNQPQELVLNPSTSTKAKGGGSGRKGRKQQKKTHTRGAFGTEEEHDFDDHNVATFDRALGGGVKGGSKKGWGIEDMFAANSKLTGLQYTYDGNPHNFGDTSEKAVRVGQDKQRSTWRGDGNDHVTNNDAPAPTYQNTVSSSARASRARPAGPITRSHSNSNTVSGSGTTGLTPTVAALFASAAPTATQQQQPAVDFPAPPALNPSVAALFASASANNYVSATVGTVTATPTLNPSVAALFAAATNSAAAAPAAPSAAPQSCAAAVSASGCGWKGGLLMPMAQ